MRRVSHAAIIERSPGHARILGAPRSGKTTLLVERFHHLVRSGNRPLVIAFGREQSDRLLARLWPDGTATFGPSPVTTHGLLAAQILSAARPNRARTLRDVDECVVLDRVMESHTFGSDLRSIAGSRALRDALLPLLHVFAQNGITQTQASSIKTRDARARDVIDLFASYRQYLDERGLVTFYDAAWAAARAVAMDDTVAQTTRADVILIDDFQDLDAGQFELLRALAPPGGKIAVEVFGDPAGARFSFRGTSARFLQDLFPRAYTPADFNLAPARPSDGVLASVIEALDPTAASEVRATPAGLDGLPLFGSASRTPRAQTDAGPAWNVRVRTVRAFDEITEVQNAAACVSDWLQAGIAPAEIAVVARESERVASTVHQVFRETGIPIDTGLASDTAVEAFVHALVGALGRDADGRFADALALSSFVDAFCAVVNESPRHLARVITSLRADYAGRGAFDLVRLLEERVVPCVRAADRDLIAAIAEEWRRYSEVVAHTGGSPSLDEFRRAYLDGGERRSHASDRVRLVTARAESGRGARAVVVIGCAEGVFPRVDTEAGYLPYAELSRATETPHAGMAADLAARVDRDARSDDERRLLYSVLCTASEQLVVSYPARVSGHHASPATVLAPLFATAIDVSRRVSPPMRAAAALAGRSHGDALGPRVHGLDTMVTGWLGAAPAGGLPRLASCRLSPSALETFSRCERKFFYAKVLRIAEPGSIYMDIGNVFHAVMKRIITAGSDGDAVRAALRSGEYAAAFDAAVAEEMDEASDWVKELTRHSIGDMLLRAVELEAERRGRYTVRSVEQLATFPADGDAVLSGRLDRVDMVDGIGLVVVDYKTGQMKRTAASLIKEIVEERKHWQVPVYSALAADEGAEPAAFLFYIIPPDGEPKVVGMQIVDGKLPAPIPDGGKSKSPYGLLGAAVVHDRLQEAMTLRAGLMNGEASFQRTDSGEECERCHFIRVCRRNQS